MASINTSPSFMSRMGSAMPGMINTLAQSYGNPEMSGMVASAGAIKPRQKSKVPPTNTPQSRFGDSGMSTMGRGINTMPSVVPFNNTGIAGPMRGPLEYNGQPLNLGGIFGQYGRMSQQGQTPFGMRY